jgi:hypothetical protein
MIKSEMDQTGKRNGFEMNKKIFGEKFVSGASEPLFI